MSSNVLATRGGEQSPLLLSAPLLSDSGAEWRDWLLLLKPRVVSLVVFTGWIGLYLAPGHLNPVLAFTAILCIAVAAGAAGAINMWYERDIDALMHRTRKRPIPAGRIEPGAALGFGVALAVGSVLVMWLATNAAAATILALSISFYVFVYTIWLKRRTPQNIVIGGAAGAFPPLIGWAAVTGSVDVLPLLLFGIVFFWTPPHFWALSLYACKDYTRAGVPMLPVVAGARETPQADLCLHARPHRCCGAAVGAGLYRADLRRLCQRAQPGVRRVLLAGAEGSPGWDGGQPDGGPASEADVPLLARLPGGDLRGDRR